MFYFRLPVLAQKIPQIRRHFSLSPTLRNAHPAGAGKCYGEELLVTLRERLLGPTSGKAYIYARWTLAGASALGVAAIGIYGLAMTRRANGGGGADAGCWPAYVRQHMRTTYAYLAGGFAITGTVVYCASRWLPCISRFPMGGWPMISVGTVLTALYAISPDMFSDNETSPATKHVAWVTLQGAIGLLLAPFCHGSGPHALRAAWYIAGIVGALSIATMCAPSDKFLNIAGPLAMGLGALFTATTFPPSALILRNKATDIPKNYPVDGSSTNRHYDRPIKDHVLIALPLVSIFICLMLTTMIG